MSGKEYGQEMLSVYKNHIKVLIVSFIQPRLSAAMQCTSHAPVSYVSHMTCGVLSAHDKGVSCDHDID